MRQVIIVPCTREKIWDSHPDVGPTPAKEAYTHPRFSVWRRYAESLGVPWFILSTKYGLLSPESPIEGYSIPVSVALNSFSFQEFLRQQGETLHVGSLEQVVLLEWERFAPLVKAAAGQTRCVLRRLLN